MLSPFFTKLFVTVTTIAIYDQTPVCQWCILMTVYGKSNVVHLCVGSSIEFNTFFIFSSLFEFMTAPSEQLRRRVYNVTAMSFTPEELVCELSKYVPDLRVSYRPDSRQDIGINQLRIMFVNINCYKPEICLFLPQPTHGHKYSMIQKHETIGIGCRSMI